MPSFKQAQPIIDYDLKKTFYRSFIWLSMMLTMVNSKIIYLLSSDEKEVFKVIFDTLSPDCLSSHKDVPNINTFLMEATSTCYITNTTNSSIRAFEGLANYTCMRTISQFPIAPSYPCTYDISVYNQIQNISTVTQSCLKTVIAELQNECDVTDIIAAKLLQYILIAASVVVGIFILGAAVQYCRKDSNFDDFLSGTSNCFGKASTLFNCRKRNTTNPDDNLELTSSFESHHDSIETTIANTL